MSIIQINQSYRNLKSNRLTTQWGKQLGFVQTHNVCGSRLEIETKISTFLPPLQSGSTIHHYYYCYMTKTLSTIIIMMQTTGSSIDKQ